MNTGQPLAESRERVRIDVSTGYQAVEIGEPALVDVEVTNLDRVIRSFHIDVLGVDPEYVIVDPPIVNLFPGERQTVGVMVMFPGDHPAGPQTIGIEVIEPRVGAPAPGVAEFVVELRGMPALSLSTEPSTLDVGGMGVFLLHPVNTGNTTLTLNLGAQDPERLVKVVFDPPRPVLKPGERTVVSATVKGPRPLVGMPVVRVLEVTASAGDVTAISAVAMVQRARIGRRFISLLGLLLVVTLFAYVIWASFTRVAQLTAENERLVQQGLGFSDETAARVEPASYRGSVVSSTGVGIGGASIKLYDEANLIRPVAATVTDGSGAFVFPAVADGIYLLKAEAAGFGELWLPDGLTPEDASPVEVADGKAPADALFTMSGRPGAINGRVLGRDVEGAFVTVQLPVGAITGSDIAPAPAVVLSAPLAADGVFALGGLATPATYEIEVSKEGFATELRTVTLEAGETRDDLEILLRRGIGIISGLVVDTAGVSIGGVTVEASDGTSRVRTRSLSGADLLGSFQLRDLTTPGSYSITFTAPGYFPATATISLTQDQQRDDLYIVMTGDRGGLSGKVTSADGAPLGGVTVTVTSSDVDRTTVTLSSGAKGTWLVSGLPVPATYTVTIGGQAWTTTAVSVDLEPGPGANRSDVNAVLRAATGSVAGSVTDTKGTPIAGVQITLERSGVTRQTISSNDPPGKYAFTNVPPGVYTLTYRRSGSSPQTLLADLGPGEELALADVQLEQQARISGYVYRDGVGAADVGVVVYRSDDYPENRVAEVVTGPGGSYVVLGLTAPESYIVDFQVPAGGQVRMSRAVFLQPDEELILCVDVGRGDVTDCPGAEGSEQQP